MKRFLTSAGLVVLGAASLEAAYAPGLSRTETSKPWSVSASLRGFYDSNYGTSPRSVRDDSFGVEASPSVSINLPMEQTFIGASYVYSIRYYEARRNNRADHSHQFNAKLDHAFSERYKLELSDSFVIAQEPELLNPSGGAIITFPLRSDGNNMRNSANADFTAQLTELLGVVLGYNNTFYDYEQTGPGSRSALLDRMEHLGSVNLRWQALQSTVGVLGYQFGLVEYTSDDSLFSSVAISPTFRDNYSHYFFVGADHNFNSQLNGSVRVGAQYTDYHELDRDSVGPYADASLTYTYAPGSHLQSGLRHSRNQTDVPGGPSLAALTVDQESTSVYASITHKLTAKLSLGALGQYQHSVFEGGLFDDAKDEFFIAGINLQYRINQHWLAETGYNYDKLNSELPGRSYTRNRVYVGVRATF